jgi:2-pyrone-4,6-dicarboxylate lactonase
MVDALVAAGDQARGIAVVDPEIGDAEAAGAPCRGRARRALQLSSSGWSIRRRAKPTRRIAERIVPLGWHIVIYFEAPELEGLAPFIGALPATVVVDHMGRPDVDLGTAHPQWQRFLALMDAHPNVWVKVSGPERLSTLGPPYDDVVPFGRELVERYPRRVLWGTDWPHPNMETHVPDDGLLVDFIPRIAPTVAAQQALLVDNPMRLYWSEN